ncbi:hypothetical protein ACX80I_17190 [Arthrobacter sp. MDT3-44]
MSDWTTITTAIGVALSGDKDRGHRLLLTCWAATTPAHHAHRCILAHYLADTEPELEQEIAWDEIALQEHGFLQDDELASLGIPSAKGLQPSLHLNLADGYHRIGRTVLAQEHLAKGRATLGALMDDGYGKMIRAGLDNLAQRLTTTTQA